MVDNAINVQMSTEPSQDPPPHSRMLPAIPILCPLCSCRLIKGPDQKEPERHIFLCSHITRTCVHLTYNLDWSLRELSFYVSGVLVRINNTHMVLQNKIMPIKTPPDVFDPAPILNIIKTFLIFQ